MQGYVTTKLSQCRAGSNEAARHIKHSLLGGVLKENGGLGDSGSSQLEFRPVLGVCTWNKYGDVQGT